MVGLVLIAAALLKAGGQSYEPFSRGGVFGSSWAQLAIIQLELLVGAWLFLRPRSVGAWLLCVGMFACFACVTFYSGYVGQSSCGCFGAVHVSPWYTFAFDAAVLVGLWLFRPEAVISRERRGAEVVAGLRTGAGRLIGLGLVSFVIIAAGYVFFGSPDKALARLRGERLLASPAPVDLGTGQMGDELTGEVSIENLSDSKIRIIAGTSDCTCVATELLPLVIEPGGRNSLPIRLSLRGSAGQVHRTVTLVTDDPRHRRVTFGVNAFVAEDERERP